MNSSVLQEKPRPVVNEGPEALVANAPARGLPLKLVASVLTLAYVVFFVSFHHQRWFSAEFIADDSRQQLFPFHSVHNPEVFAGDIIATMMQCYLAPLHLGLGKALTYFTHNPVMSGHWITLLQLLLALGFLFTAVRKGAGFIAACFSVVWLLHTEPLFERMAGGLPRGWAAPLIAAYLCAIIYKRHYAVLAVILAGCLLNPPAAALIAVSYGMLLAFRMLMSSTREETKKPFWRLVLLSPLYILLTLSVIDHPQEVGSMATEEEATKNPSFSRIGGRFKFLPLLPPAVDIQGHGTRAFLSLEPGALSPEGKAMTTVVVALLLALLITGVRARSRLLPLELLTLVAASLLLYFAARELLFLLYVPNRYLREPLMLFFFVAFPIGVWRLAGRASVERVRAFFKKPARALTFVSALAVSSVFVLGSSYNAEQSPRYAGQAFYKIGVDSWVEEGSMIRLVGLNARANTIALTFDHWRPGNIGPAEMTVSICGSPVKDIRISVPRQTETISLRGDCLPRTVEFSVKNPFVPVTPGDARKLGAKLTSFRVSSALGLPIVTWGAYGLLFFGLGFIALFVIAYDGQAQRSLRAAPALLGLSLLGVLIFVGSGTGAPPQTAFAVHVAADDPFYAWIKNNTEETDLIAGEPSLLDEMPLFGMRRTYLTSETAHPFYDSYFEEIKRRMNILWRAYYARDRAQFSVLLTAEGVDYFVFRRSDFEPESLKKAGYHRPFDRLVKKLTRSVDSAYAYHSFAEAGEEAEGLVYQDQRVLVVRLKPE